MQATLKQLRVYLQTKIGTRDNITRVTDAQVETTIVSSLESSLIVVPLFRGQPANVKLAAELSTICVLAVHGNCLRFYIK